MNWKRKKRWFELPKGSDWVFRHPWSAIKSVTRPGMMWTTWFPYIRAALLLAALPLWFLAASLNFFWLVVLALTCWYIGWAVLSNIMLSKYPIDGYIKSVMAGGFWVAVVRLLVIGGQFLFSLIGG